MAATAIRADDDPVFYFTVVFWGAEHRGYFLDLLLASLLAPGNIPALDARDRSRFLICTTEEDWRAIQDAPNFVRLRALVEPVWIKFPDADPGESKMAMMSRGHALMSEAAFRAKAIGVFVTPDLILSDGAVAALQRIARQGYSVALCTALRFAHEGFFDELVARGFIRPGQPMRIAARELTRLGLQHLHSETLRFDIGVEDFAENPSAVFWRIPGGGILIRNFSWAPLLVNYAHVSAHSTETFKDWTLDGDYVFRNFGHDPRRIHAVTDSDEITLVSFTKESEHSFLPLKAIFLLRSGLPAYLVKLFLVRRFFHGVHIDPLKRRLFRRAVRWHGTALGARWTIPTIKSAVFVALVSARFSACRWLDSRFQRLWNDRLAKYYGHPLLQRARPHDMLALEWHGSTRVRAGSVAEAVLNFQVPKVGRVQLYRVGPAIRRGRWYWEVASSNFGRFGPFVAATGTIGVIRPGARRDAGIGADRRGWGWRGDGTKITDGRIAPCGDGATTADEVVMVALDLDAGKLWFGRNGAWFDGGDPRAGSNPAFANVAGPVFFAMSSLHGFEGSALLAPRSTAGALAYAPPPGFQLLDAAEQAAQRDLPVAAALLGSASGSAMRASGARARRCLRSVFTRAENRARAVFGPTRPSGGRPEIIGACMLVRASATLHRGRWYGEVFSPNLGAFGPSVAATGIVGAVPLNVRPDRAIGDDNPGWAWRGDGYKLSRGRAAPYGTAATGAGEVIMIAVDVDAGKLWFGRNGVWFEDGDPASGARPGFAGIAGPVFLVMSASHGASGTAVLAFRSNVDAFSFAPPAGFLPVGAARDHGRAADAAVRTIAA